MKRWLVLCSVLIAAMLLMPSARQTLAQDTPTPTDTPTSTATATATPALVSTGVTSGNQGYEIKRSVTAGDVVQILIMLIGIGLFCFVILLETKQG